MDDPKIYVKKKKLKKKRFSILPTLTFFLVIGGFGLSSYLAYEYALERNTKMEAGYEVYVNRQTAKEIRIPFNSNTEDIADLLFENGMIRSTTIFKIISNIFGYDGRYRSGTHLLNEGMKYEDIMIILTSMPEIVRVTFPEGFTVEQIKARLAANGLADTALFDETENGIDLDGFEKIRPFRTRDHRVEGYLFPDTYEFDINAGETFIITRLLRRFEEMFDDELVKRAEEIEMSIDDIIIMASLLEKEASTFDERRKIAGVLYNRLVSEDESINFLQVDATLQYIIVKRGGTPKQTLTYEDTRMIDRYNTYLHKGLPPGPICNPGMESIMAALYPERHDFYFYVVDPQTPGRHIYSRTYEEHLQAMGN